MRLLEGVDNMYHVWYNIDMKTIFKYSLPNGKIPFDEWFNELDKSVKAKVLVRIERLKYGLYGKHRNLKNNISELKFESGERIYFYERNNTIILLLYAGNKQRQSKDITTAIEYLQDYTERTKLSNEK